MAKTSRRRTTKQQPSNQLAVIVELARLDWRLNFYTRDGVCSLVSVCNVPAFMRKLKLGIGDTIRVDFKSSAHDAFNYVKLRRLTDKLELLVDSRILQYLVVHRKFKIRCNYQLEAIEQMLIEPIRQYHAIFCISDNKWNKSTVPLFRYLRGETSCTRE